MRIDNYPPVFKSLTTNEEISELVVYLDEDSQAGGVRGWLRLRIFTPKILIPTPSPRPGLGMVPRESSSSLAHAEVNGTGVRPQVFQYQVVGNFFGEDLFHLKAFDGHRYALLPVRVQVRPVPDDPSFAALVPSVIFAKVGSALVGTLEHKGSGRRQSQDRSCRAPAGEEGFWLGILRHERDKRDGCAARGSASWDSGKVYPLALVVTDSTGRYATVNSKLIIDGENRSPIIRGPETVKLTFDQAGQSKASDLASIFATDLDGDALTWSLSPLSAHKYGVPKVSGTGARPMELSYLTYGSQTADAFVIRVSDAESFDELKDHTHGRVVAFSPSSRISIRSRFRGGRDAVLELLFLGRGE